MDWSNQYASVYTNNTRRSFSILKYLQRTWPSKSYDYKQSNRGYKRDRHNKYLLTIKALCLSALSVSVTAPVNAETVGGVSATASPVANSSGSVTNQAIQVLQGPYITNTYGAGIQCQGETVNFTPFITGSASAQKPYEDFFDTPVYDMRDMDEDGAPDNPGDILWMQPTRTGQKDNYNLSVGISATWSVPRDKKLQQLCKEAAQSNIALMQQANANKRLDFEIARLKNCGELMKSGIRFTPGTKYAKICADVQVQGVNFMVPHVHKIPKAKLKVSTDASVLSLPISIGD